MYWLLVSSFEFRVKITISSIPLTLGIIFGMFLLYTGNRTTYDYNFIVCPEDIRHQTPWERMYRYNVLPLHLSLFSM
jgi:hypothetical protein